jgi:hypothetical protein
MDKMVYNRAGQLKPPGGPYNLYGLAQGPRSDLWTLILGKLFIQHESFYITNENY